MEQKLLLGLGGLMKTHQGRRGGCPDSAPLRRDRRRCTWVSVRWSGVRAGTGRDSHRCWPRPGCSCLELQEDQPWSEHCSTLLVPTAQGYKAIAFKPEGLSFSPGASTPFQSSKFKVTLLSSEAGNTCIVLWDISPWATMQHIATNVITVQVMIEIIW